MKFIEPLKIKSKYFIEKINEPDEEGTHILFYESETLHGCNYQRVFKGTYQECKKEKEKREKNVSKSKEKREKNVSKSKGRSFGLLKRALHNK